jgi:hypothetical protein
MAPSRRLLVLVGLVAIVHGSAIAIYYGMRIGQRAPEVRTGFLLAWMAVTLAVVLTQLRRLRLERSDARRGRGR